MMDPFDSGAQLDPSVHSSVVRALVEDSVHIPDTQQYWKETDEEHVFTATLPAFDKGIEDEFCYASTDPDARTLRVNGKQTIEEVKDQETWKLVQGYTISFNCIIKLPEDVEINDMTATIKQSKLTATLPKRKTSPARMRTAHEIEYAKRPDYDPITYNAASILQSMSSEPQENS